MADDLVVRKWGSEIYMMEFQFLRNEHNAVCRVGASFLASTWPDAVPREILAAARRIYLVSGHEHEGQPRRWPYRSETNSSIPIPSCTFFRLCACT
jgi:hypothetical protein